MKLIFINLVTSKQYIFPCDFTYGQYAKFYRRPSYEDRLELVKTALLTNIDEYKEKEAFIFRKAVAIAEKALKTCHVIALFVREKGEKIKTK